MTAGAAIAGRAASLCSISWYGGDPARMRGGTGRSATRRRRSRDCRGATVARCSVASSNIHAGELCVQVTLAILPPVRGETGSAVVPALGAPIIRKSGKVIGIPLGHRRYRRRLHSHGRRQKVPGTLDVCGLRAFIHITDRKSGRCHVSLRRSDRRVYRKAWRGPAPGPRQWSSCTASASTRALYHWLGNALNAAGIDRGATRSATDSPRATSGFGRALFEFAEDKPLELLSGSRREALPPPDACPFHSRPR